MQQKRWLRKDFFMMHTCFNDMQSHVKELKEEEDIHDFNLRNTNITNICMTVYKQKIEEDNQTSAVIDI